MHASVALAKEGPVVAQTHPFDRSLFPDVCAVNSPGAAPTPVSESLQAQEVAGAQPALTADVFVPNGGDDMLFAEHFSESSLIRASPRSPPVIAHLGLARSFPPCLELLPNEILLHVLGFLDVCDLLATSRTNHHLRSLSLSPILHQDRLRHYRIILPPLLYSPSRPSLADLISRSIFMTNTSVVSRRLARSLVSIRLSRRLAARPSPEALVSRAVLPPECVPGLAGVHVAPGLVATRKAIEKERLKDGLRRWMASKWRSEVTERQEHVRKADESRGVGRVWRLTRFWERVSRGEGMPSW